MILDDSATTFIVLINDELQHSLWAQSLAIPAGWQDVGISGTKEECLAYVEANWTDLRPKSLQDAMSATA